MALLREMPVTIGLSKRDEKTIYCIFILIYLLTAIGLTPGGSSTVQWGLKKHAVRLNIQHKTKVV